MDISAMIKKSKNLEPLIKYTGFDNVMAVSELLRNDSFGRYLDECEEKQTVRMKVRDKGLVFRTGMLKIHIPIDACAVQFPKCDKCDRYYLGHHKIYCRRCLKQLGYNKYGKKLKKQS